MDIYTKQKKWKFALLIFAIIIGFSSLFVTNRLVKKLKKEENKKIELWAAATKHLVKISGEGDYSLAIKIINENKNIPVILVDECDSILESKNFNIYNNIDSLLFKLKIRSPRLITQKFLRQELNSIREDGDDPIEVNIIGDKQWIYYKDSAMLYQLRYYPFYQLAFISIFMFIAYFIFSASRKSEQNKVWAGMAKETAHQIGTPLSSLMAWVELLKEKTKEKNLVDEMNKDVLRLKTIADRFSKIGSKSELEQVNIVMIIENAIEYLKSRMPKNTSFKIEYVNKNIQANINITLFAWVIENLVKNAVDAIKGKGEIILLIEEKNSNVCINISDNGEGINSKIIKSIFKPGVTSKKRGWGLGLSLSKRIIKEYHKGEIYVLKSEKNQGTTFTIKLPKVD
tara:strand:- start:269 stop:1465 length:1197 start_codon:yes stop_codon:yes gene_type:complete